MAQNLPRIGNNLHRYQVIFLGTNFVTKKLGFIYLFIYFDFFLVLVFYSKKTRLFSLFGEGGYIYLFIYFLIF
jgi:hypothetical protein